MSNAECRISKRCIRHFAQFITAPKTYLNPITKRQPSTPTQGRVAYRCYYKEINCPSKVLVRPVKCFFFMFDFS
jgi:hypothetical protein